MRQGFPVASRGMVVGLLGGSFDPAHEGHVHITREALKRMGLDQVWWLVSPGNPLKARQPAPMADRLARAMAVMRDPRVKITALEERLGTRATYDFLDGNRDMEAWPVDYVNDPAVIARNERMVSVNATLQVDLTGACCSEHLNGRQFTASGGQLDFVRGAYASAGARSIVACHSTAAKGTVSRIVARLDGPVTVPRNDVHIIVTEHGRAELKGKSDAERARALIAVADPKFRDDLERSARGMGLLD